MKIGILTFHYAHNYGAVLQAYALKKYLLSLDENIDVCIVNYRNQAIADAYQKKLKCEIRFADCESKREYLNWVVSHFEKLYAQHQWSTQYKRFEAFITNVLLDGENKITGQNELSSLNYDVFVAGSDQIWNKHLTKGNDDAYFLNFPTDAKKAFYAASNGAGVVQKKDDNYYCSVLKEADFISTREPELAEYIKLTFGLNAYSVLDPCLLLDKKDYLDLTDTKRISARRYIFVYYIVEDETMQRVADFLSEELHLPLIEMHFYKELKNRKRNQRADFGPEEFLKGIRDADFVITNSFHGTVFSILFQKMFYSVYNEDVRKDNLLAGLDLTDRHIYSLNEMNLSKQIDYSKTREKLLLLRQASYDYINMIVRK